MTPEAAAADAFPDSVPRLRVALAEFPLVLEGLWPTLAQLDWAMRLPSEAAPGFVYLAGVCCGRPVGGGGRNIAEAAGRLTGEAAEVLAQSVPSQPAKVRADPAIAAIHGEGPCLLAINLTRGNPSGAPMAAIYPDLARAPGAPPCGLGLAAGPTAAAARLAAVLELVERDAAAAWWSGATRPRALGLVETAPAATLLACMRREARAPQRPTLFLALPSLTALPVVCALSRDAGSRGLVFGFKAALDPGAAIEGALFELLQMEIALEIARLRSDQGRATPADAGPMGRAALDPDAFDAFAPLPPTLPAAPSIAGLEDLVAHLARSGLEVTVADLPMPRDGLCVAKAFIPGLRPLPGPGPEPRPGSPGERAALM